MPFIGKSPTAGFASIVKDDLTPNGSTTAFTLSKQVANANDIAVFLGNVRQEPTDAYTVSGTTLTMSEAPASGLNFYVLHIAGTHESSVVPADNTISTAKIQNDAITTAKIATNAVGSDALDLTVVNGPTFKAHKTIGAAQDNITQNTSTKVLFQTEVWDTASDYDTSNSRYTPSKAGYYLFTVAIQIEHADNTSFCLPLLYKNGSEWAQGNASTGYAGVYPSTRATWIVPMNGSSDYVEGYVYGGHNGGAFNMADNTAYRNEFEGIWVRDL